MDTRETVCIAFTMAVIHDIEAKAADVLNTYLMVLNEEKIWRALGSEFEDNAGKSAIIVRGVYVLKTVGASFRADLAQFMWESGCKLWSNLTCE